MRWMGLRAIVRVVVISNSRSARQQQIRADCESPEFLRPASRFPVDPTGGREMLVRGL